MQLLRMPGLIIVEQVGREILEWIDASFIMAGGGARNWS
jgi:hypothetical protein